MPIYLYVKTHNKTGLKYLGMTKKPNPHLYPGSGIHWVRHLKKHGYDYSTEIIKECQSKEELSYWGEYYSNLWNIVQDDRWANLKPETGDGGDMSMVESYQIGIKNRKHGRQPGQFRHSEESKAKIKDKRKSQTILPHTDKSKEKIRASRIGKPMSEESKAKMRATKALKRITSS